MRNDIHPIDEEAREQEAMAAMESHPQYCHECERVVADKAAGRLYCQPCADSIEEWHAEIEANRC